MLFVCAIAWAGAAITFAAGHWLGATQWPCAVASSVLAPTIVQSVKLERGKRDARLATEEI